MAISTRFLAPSLFIRLARCVLTVLRLMWSSSAISALVRPRATVTRTSSSRAVRGSIGWRQRLAGPYVGERSQQPDCDARSYQCFTVGGGMDRLA